VNNLGQKQATQVAPTDHTAWHGASCSVSRWAAGLFDEVAQGLHGVLHHLAVPRLLVLHAPQQPPVRQRRRPPPAPLRLLELPRTGVLGGRELARRLLRPRPTPPHAPAPPALSNNGALRGALRGALVARSLTLVCVPRGPPTSSCARRLASRSAAPRRARSASAVCTACASSVCWRCSSSLTSARYLAASSRRCSSATSSCCCSPAARAAASRASSA
jgi:hypothetical protein